MKSNFLKSILLLAVMATVSSCTDTEASHDAGTPTIQTYELTPTKTVTQIITAATAAPTEYTAEDVIEAYVTSTDAAGTFYKSISFQDVQAGGATAPKGFSVSVDGTMLFKAGFTPGRKVYIKLKGLYIAKIYGSLQIGLKDPTDPTQITGISNLDYLSYLYPSATEVDESTLVSTMALSAASDDTSLNRLIEISNIEFADNSLARTYFDVDSGGYATNHDIVDATTGGRSRYCRISQYAPFSVNNVPSGRGTIRGVMTKYKTDYQFIVRSESDFKLTNPRTYNFVSTLSENFSSYPTTTRYYDVTRSTPSYVSFPKYLNFATVGAKKWFVIDGGYLEMSAYGGDVENTKTYFMVPVNMTDANSLKFDLKVGYFTNALGLKVYRTMDYVPGMKITDATLYDITTSFNLPSASQTTFTTAGTYNIPASITGNGYFVFEYVGTNISTGPAVTTTIDIDNIVIN